MWQAEADTELTLSASPTTAVGVNLGELALQYGNYVQPQKQRLARNLVER